VSAVTVAVSEAVYQRLHRLSSQAGKSPEAVLDQALAEYEYKLLSQSRPGQQPRAAAEAELLDDLGRIRKPPRDVKSVAVRVVAVGRATARLSEEE
jgi:predicted transcriptional regulator